MGKHYSINQQELGDAEVDPQRDLDHIEIF
jgi:hypothetical protein